jgi:glycosyltransferase involved in cell wall biosynthesis
VPPAKVVVIPNGVDMDFFTPLSDAARPFEGFSVVYMGGLEPWQGIDLLIRAIHEVRQQDNLPIHAVIAGDGPSRHDFERLAVTLGLTTCVKFLGTVARETVPYVIAGGDVGYSGHTESQGRAVFRSPLKLYEYMAMAKPVISSPVADARALLTDGDTGFFFDTADTGGLAQALRRAYAMRANLPIMGARARQVVEHGHSWTARCEAIVSAAERIALELP